MRKIKFFAVLFLCLCLTMTSTGCDSAKHLLAKWRHEEDAEVTTTEASHGVYQMNLGETRLIKAAYELTAESTEELIGQFIEGMKQTPSDNAYKSVISGDVQVENYTYDSNNRLATLYFNASYNKLPAAREILTRAAIVKTLTQFSDEIQYVAFIIGNTPMTTEDGSLMMMRGRDFIDNISGNMEYVREDYVTMYFVSEDGTKLQAEDVIIKYLSKINLETALVNSLISGPITKGLKPSLSPDTVVYKVNIREDICYVDLNRTFLERVNGQSFELNIYSVVNTLTQMTGVSRVQFLIDGVIFSGTVEGMRIDGLFEKNMSLVSRPEKEMQNSSSGPLEGKDAMQKDIEHQVIENQKNAGNTVESKTETSAENPENPSSEAAGEAGGQTQGGMPGGAEDGNAGGENTGE